MSSRRPRLLLLLSQAQHHLVKAADATFLEAIGITVTQLGVLFLLEQRPGVLAKDVSETFGINPSAITGLIDRMARAGLVRRQPSAHDGRAVQLFATADGLAKASAGKPILNRLNARVTRGFSAREVATVARFLEAIAARFQSS